MLTPAMAKTVSFIRVFNDDHGYSPSFAEMQEGLGYKSKSRVFHLLKALEERGHIRRLRYRSRAIEVIDSPSLRDDLSGHTIQELAREAKRRDLVLGHWLLDIERDDDGNEISRKRRFLPVTIKE